MQQILEMKGEKGKAWKKNMLKRVANGHLRPELNGKDACARYGVGLSFRKRKWLCAHLEPQSRQLYSQLSPHSPAPTVFKQCIAFEPMERPSMADVVHRLVKIRKQVQAKPIAVDSPFFDSRSLNAGATAPRVLNTKVQAVKSPWEVGSPIESALQTLPWRILDPTVGDKLERLCKEVEELLGAKATSTSSGVYNPARLYHLLCINQMDVQDAKSMVVLNSNARVEFGMDAKRSHIVRSDLSFTTLPRETEWREYQVRGGGGRGGSIVLLVGSKRPLGSDRLSSVLFRSSQLDCHHLTSLVSLPFPPNSQHSPTTTTSGGRKMAVFSRTTAWVQTQTWLDSARHLPSAITSTSAATLESSFTSSPTPSPP